MTMNSCLFAFWMNVFISCSFLWTKMQLWKQEVTSTIPLHRRIVINLNVRFCFVGGILPTLMGIYRRHRILLEIEILWKTWLDILVLFLNGCMCTDFAVNGGSKFTKSLFKVCIFWSLQRSFIFHILKCWVVLCGYYALSCLRLE